MVEREAAAIIRIAFFVHNLSSHKASGAVDAIEAVGANVMLLPPYSPGLNPIEMMRSKIKAILRRLKIRVKEQLADAIAFALSQISSSNTAGWFSHDGYQLHGSRLL